MSIHCDGLLLVVASVMGCALVVASAVGLVVVVLADRRHRRRDSRAASPSGGRIGCVR